MRFKQTVFLLSALSCLEANEISSLLFNGNCLTCHNETKTISAPSVVDIKKRYLDAFSKKDDFVDYMSKWVEHPKKETSLMHDAIKKHELMPELNLDIDTLREISAYIYETDFTKRGGRYWSD